MSEALDILYWRNVQRSGVAFGIGLLFFYLVTLGEHTIVGLSASTCLVLLTLFTLYNFIAKIFNSVQNPRSPKKAGRVEYVCQETVTEFSSAAADTINYTFTYAKRVAHCDDWSLTFKTYGILVAIYVLGSMFSGMFLSFTCFILAFSVPRAYEMNKTLVDQNLEMVGKLYKENVEVHVSTALKAIPKASDLKSKSE
eukprot:GFYU01000307.1.p1 GENE.GFYU01000307.1~~GFYU01000307.1.p1  ORF type:complete len:230 (+),score=53.01 GFYU01000307.1:101-691(+)